MNPPELIEFASMAGDDSITKVKHYESTLYAIFLNDIVNGSLTFNGLPIRCRWHEPFDGKHFTFWHLITKSDPACLRQQVEIERNPDYQRCARISWIKWAILNADNTDICRQLNQSVKSERGYRDRLVLWLYEYDYAVVLEPRPTYCLLVTAFCVHEHQKQTFEKRYQSQK